MSATRKRTKHPGIFKRGSSYEFIYRDRDGKQHHETASTLRDAITRRSQRLSEVAEGRYEPACATTLTAYLLEWIETYQGRGSRGFRESTRNDYRRDIKRYIVPFFDNQPNKSIAQIGPRDIARFVAFLCDEETQGRYLADSTVKRILSPLRAGFATAVAQGLVRHNPTTNIALPARDQQRAIDMGTDHLERESARALETRELADFLQVCPKVWRLYFQVLAATGIRVSESFALRWTDLSLDGATPHVWIRRAYVRGRFGPPKSKHGNRKIPIGHDLVVSLRSLKKTSTWNNDDDLVFPAENGMPLRQENVRRRVLKPTAEEAGVPWVGFHSFRHTCATQLFGAGRNAAQVQRWLGHHSAAFTLNVYVHLLDDDLGEPLALPSNEISGSSLACGSQDPPMALTRLEPVSV